MNETMTSVERVSRVLDGRIPDRIPVDLHNFLMTARASGMPFSEYLQNGEAMAEGHIQAWRTFGHDVLLLENGTTALAEACGCQVEYLSDSAPVVVGPAIRSLSEMDRLTLPDPFTVHPLAENLKATRRVVQEIGSRAFIMGRADQGPFSLASMLIGLEPFLVALSDPDCWDQLHRLLDFSLEVVYRYAAAQIEQGAHMTSIGESLSGPDVTSPRMYREFEWGYARRLVERLREKNIPLAYHICGNATRIVPDMAATGAAVLELDYKCDLALIKAAARGKTTILGVLDPSAVMALGTPELVRSKARQAIDVLAPGGGFILGPGCSLPATTPAENVHALIEVAREFGHYREDGSLAAREGVE
jgi:MtaA/CmuA family methyltransferase